MKYTLIVLIAMTSFSGLANADGSCITVPTLTCMRGYEEVQNADGCFECVEREPEHGCVTSPTIECIPGYHEVQKANGCFSCAKN